MLRKALIATLALAIPAASAIPQTMVIGGGLASDCYKAVKAGETNFRKVDRICTDALRQETLTRENRAATYINRGIARMRADNLEDSLEDYQSALDLRPDLGAAYLNRGAALIFMDDYEAAREALDKAIELETEDLHAAYYNRAIAREQSGDVAGAYYDFQSAKERKPDWERVDRQLARFTITQN